MTTHKCEKSFQSKNRPMKGISMKTKTEKGKGEERKSKNGIFSVLQNCAILRCVTMEFPMNNATKDFLLWYLKRLQDPGLSSLSTMQMFI